MSDSIHHECGVALLRLLKPLDFYFKKYGSTLYGLNKMYLLLEKQHNRGQDGVGLANVKLDVEAGKRYISRKRAVGTDSLQNVFEQANRRFVELEKSDPDKLKNGTSASPAIALANNVLPVPGGPINNTPLGILAPISL